MKVIVNNNSMVPIYEQIMEQIKLMIKKGELHENDILPSVRVLSKELKISALTVKKAYDNLEQEGYTITVHGKGTYVVTIDEKKIIEEQKKEVENDIFMAIQKGRKYGLADSEIVELVKLIVEE